MDLAMYKQVFASLSKNEIAWLVTVVHTDGSTPGKIGMKMLVKESGELLGTIGGGTIEKLIIDKIITEKFVQGVLLSFDLGSDGVFIKTGMICGGQQEVFVEPLFTNRRLYIIGGGHCGQALAELMAKSNFMVTVIDERQEWITPEKHPYATTLVQAEFNDMANHIVFTPETFIVVMTHSHNLDEKVLQEFIDREYKYLGVIGSKTKAKTILQHLQKNNCQLQKLQKIFMPIGFDLGTQTPYEIAISIAAQILAVKNGKDHLVFNSNPLFGGESLG